MQTIVCNFSVLAVATLFYYWRGYRLHLQQRRQALCQRVTYMLWTMAQTIP
jgi:ammonia channel protein AmtB